MHDVDVYLLYLVASQLKIIFLLGMPLKGVLSY